MKKVKSNFNKLLVSISLTLGLLSQKIVSAITDIRLEPLYGVPDPKPTTVFTVITVVFKFILLPLLLIIGVVVLICNIVKKVSVKKEKNVNQENNEDIKSK